MGWTHELEALRDSLAVLLHQDTAESDIYNIKVTSAEKLPDGSLYFGEGWQVSIENDTGSTIDAVNVRMKFEDAYHEQIISLATAYHDIQITDMMIADGSAYTNIGTSQYLPFPTIGFDATKYLYFTVLKYHTTDGETVIIPEDECLWFVANR